MTRHINLRAIRPVIVTAMAAICFGTVTVPYLASATAPASAGAMATAKPAPTPDGPGSTPWG
jgi:hypothetical protein